MSTHLEQPGLDFRHAALGFGLWALGFGLWALGFAGQDNDGRH